MWRHKRSPRETIVEPQGLHGAQFWNRWSRYIYVYNNISIWERHKIKWFNFIWIRYEIKRISSRRVAKINAPRWVSTLDTARCLPASTRFRRISIPLGVNAISSAPAAARVPPGVRNPKRRNARALFTRY